MQLKTIITLFLLKTLTTSLKVIEENKTPYIIPSIKNKLTPFRLEPSNIFDSTVEFKISRTCSDSVTKNLTFKSTSKLICNGKSLFFHISYLNLFLESLEIELENNDIDFNEKMIIVYDLEHKDENGLQIKWNFHQYIKIINEVPVIIKHSKFEFKEETEISFKIEVLQIPEDYSYSHKEEFMFNNLGLKLPSWMKYDFEKRSFFLSGKIPEDYFESYNLVFEIKDLTVDLKTDFINFDFKMIPKEKIEEKSLSTGYIILIIILILIIVVFVLGFFYWRYKKNKENKDEIGKDFKNNKKIKDEISKSGVFYGIKNQGDKKIDDTFEDNEEKGFDIKFKDEFKKRDVIKGKNIID